MADNERDGKNFFTWNTKVIYGNKYFRAAKKHYMIVSKDDHLLLFLMLDSNKPVSLMGIFVKILSLWS